MGTCRTCFADSFQFNADFAVENNKALMSQHKTAEFVKFLTIITLVSCLVLVLRGPNPRAVLRLLARVSNSLAGDALPRFARCRHQLLRTQLILSRCFLRSASLPTC